MIPAFPNFRPEILCAAVARVDCDKRGHIGAVIVANKAGLAAFRAKVYVDATGDADLAAWAGAKYEKGDEKGNLQLATHCFTLSNVDTYAYEHCEGLKYSPKGNAIEKIVASGR